MTYTWTSEDGGLYESVPSTHPAISSLWRAVVTQPYEWTDAANEFWGLALTRGPDGARSVELVGPALRPRPLVMEPGHEHWGVELAAHVVVVGVPKRGLLDVIVDLPVSGSWFELAGVRYPFVDHDGLPGLIDAMLAQGTLVADPALGAALDGAGWSERSLQRHVRDQNGLSPKQVEQRRRVRHAYALMQQGLPLAEAAVAAGYSDQAHMTRDFGLLAGITPARVLREYLDGERGDVLR